MTLSTGDQRIAATLADMFMNLLDYVQDPAFDSVMFKAKVDSYAKLYQKFDKSTNFIGGGEVCALINERMASHEIPC